MAVVPGRHAGAAQRLGFVRMLAAAALIMLRLPAAHLQFNIGLSIALVGLAGFAGWALLVRR